MSKKKNQNNLNGAGKVRQVEINGVAWRACDTFRGVVDPSEYKNYILVMLFLRYLSDIWRDMCDKFHRVYKGDEARINRKLSRMRFVLPKNTDFYYLYENRNAPNIGELINMALEAIEEANKQKLDGVFRNIDFNSEANLGKTKDRNKRLKSLLEDFAVSELDLRPSRIGNLDIIGNTYEYLIAKFASDAGKKGGEFYTPGEVSLVIAKCMRPKKGDRIGDMACGSGSLLIKTAREVGDADFSVFGQESNGSTWALCKMNMFLHEIDEARIEWGDTIRNPMLVEGDALIKFDVSVANPPFSLDKWGYEEAESDRYRRFHRGVPPRSKGDYAFISHMVETMKENTGRAGIVVPLGVLFRGGAEGRIRKRLVEDDNLLDVVIGLPPNLFFGTGIPAAILVFKKARKTTDVLFIDASSEFQKGTNQNVLRDQDIEKIVQTYVDYKTVDKYAYRATLGEIRENEYNLNIPRYVDTFMPEERVDIEATKKEIAMLENELSEVRTKMAKYLEELGL